MCEMVYLTVVSAVIFVLLCYVSVFLGAIAVIPLSACFVGLIGEYQLNREEKARFARSRPLRWNGHFYD